MGKGIVMGVAMAVLGTSAGVALAEEDLAGLAEARGTSGRIDASEVTGVGDCPVILSVDTGLTGPGATRGAARLKDGWVVGGAPDALLRTLDECARPDSNPSQLASIVSAMAMESPLTPILDTSGGLVRDKLADAGRGYLPPETAVTNGVVRLTFQAVPGEGAPAAEVVTDWTPGRSATVKITPY